MKTYSAKASEIKRDWYVIDAKEQVLGRLATEIARRLRGKHKPQYTPHMDLGDHVIVINADKIRVTGKKQTDKVYYRHSGYPGGIYQRTFQEHQNKFPGVKLLLPSLNELCPPGPLNLCYSHSASL